MKPSGLQSKRFGTALRRGLCLRALVERKGQVHRSGGHQTILAPPAHIAHLLCYDSVARSYWPQVLVEGRPTTCGRPQDRRNRRFRNPRDCTWQDVESHFECTAFFTDRARLRDL